MKFQSPSQAPYFSPKLAALQLSIRLVGGKYHGPYPLPRWVAAPHWASSKCLFPNFGRHKAWRAFFVRSCLQKALCFLLFRT